MIAGQALALIACCLVLFGLRVLGAVLFLGVAVPLIAAGWWCRSRGRAALERDLDDRIAQSRAAAGGSWGSEPRERVHR